MSRLKLAHGLAFEALYTRDGLSALDGQFCRRLERSDTALFNRLMAARADPDRLEAKAESELLIELAPQLEDFLAELFGIEAELAALEAEHERLAPLYTCKRLFVQRESTRAHGEAEAAAFDGAALTRSLDEVLGTGWGELDFAAKVMEWREDEAKNATLLDLARRYAAWAVFSADGKARHRSGVLFKIPHKLDPNRLVPVVTEKTRGYEVMRVDTSHAPRREGLDLTDPGADLRLGLDDANYCIWCHNQGKDSCSKGLKEKQGAAFRKSVFGVTLAGCPLEEKISEMHLLKAEGHPLGALAVVCVDNPLAALTGHRVCNDCMKSCVYQRQDPVNIPRSETRILADVLALPWGVEIYALMGRWNPLDLRRPLPKPASGKKVLVVGLGPAGCNLAHHLMNEGHSVVAVEGLKLEPLPPELSGVTPEGARAPFEPVERYAQIWEHLDERIMAGFGGLSEYGITVRWDKNHLKLVRLILERRAQFRAYGAVRFGGTLGVEEAWALGFDHIALCVGAGRPTMLEVPNGLARGVRAANDYLMGLQPGVAGGQAGADLELRLPVVVIGAGLTAGDTATESLAYYPLQVEKFLARYETLAAEAGEAALRAEWSEEERETADEFLAHARALRVERKAAAAEGRPARLRELLESWGGVTIAYRRRLIDSPSYTLNHEEVEKALEEGVGFAECLSPDAVEVDHFGHAKAIRMMRMAPGADGKLAPSGEVVSLPARSILVAAGTQPNTVLAREDGADFKLDGRYFQALDEMGHPVTPERVAKPHSADVLVHLAQDGRAISTYGDTHASFAGNVVKAMASAKRAYPLISRLLAQRPPADGGTDEDFFARLNVALRPRVKEVRRLAPGVVELVVEAPLAARSAKPGQFFRLQNFESSARKVGDTVLAAEAIALFPSALDAERGLVSLVLAGDGGSKALAATLRPGELVALMGPNGMPAALPDAGAVLLAGSGYGVAALLPLARAAKAKGLQTLVVASFGASEERFLEREIEAAADVVVWVAERGAAIHPSRKEDKSFRGALPDALAAYASARMGEPAVALSHLTAMFALGPSEHLAALAAARSDGLARLLPAEVPLIASFAAPMQCMMKEICGRCLQPVRDAASGKTKLVFACVEPNLPLAEADAASLRERLAQNGLAEKLTRRWIARCLNEASRAR